MTATTKVLTAEKYVPTVDAFRIFDDFGLYVNPDGSIVAGPNDCRECMGGAYADLTPKDQAYFNGLVRARAARAGLVDLDLA